MIRPLIVLLLLMASTAAHADVEQCVWHSGTGTAIVDNITPHDAERLAINRARIAAAEQEAPISIAGATMVTNSMLATDITAAFINGLIVKQSPPKLDSTLVDGGKDKAAIQSITATVRACIATQTAIDPYFTLTVGTDHPVYLDMGEIVLTASAGRDAYLAIFHVDDDETVTMLLPNDQFRQIAVKQGERHSFPPEGMGLRARLKAGKVKETESFIVVATRQWFDFSGVFRTRKIIDLSTLFSALARLTPRERAIAFAPIEIRAHN